MDAAQRYEFLARLDREYEPRLRGKILQRLLQLAFHHAGYRLAEERISEGIDFDVVHREHPERRYSIEARTTEGFTVPVKLEDLRQMDAREAEGFRAGIAALRIAPGAHWVFIARAWLRPGPLRVSTGNTPGWEDVAAEVNARFAAALDRYGAQALAEGLEGLEADVQEAESS